MAAVFLTILLLTGAPAWPGEPDRPVDELGEVDLSAGVSAYVAAAAGAHPELRAAYDRWSASTHRIARTRGLPNPTVSFGLFVKSVETRAGPQQARIGIQQAFPWPTTLTAGADAAAAEAQAAQRQLEATGLAITQRVVAAYWSLWAVRTTRYIHQKHLSVIDDLASTLRARMVVGGATLADLLQVDLSRARLADAIAGMDEQEAAAAAALRAAAGLPSDTVVPTTPDAAEATLPVEVLADLIAGASMHPRISAVAAQADAADARIRAASAQRLPGAMLGVDWILTGPAADPTMPDSGQDAVVVGVGVSVPLWQRRYGEDIAAAEATASALRADQQARADQVAAAVAQAAAQVRDSARRIQIYGGTLLPQSRAAYSSLLGGYTIGSASVAQVLLAQRDLLELSAALEGARADHARAWADLDAAVGRPVARRPATSEAP